MSTSKMEMNGRIVVPKDIRKAIGARLGTRFVWEVMHDGTVRVAVSVKRQQVQAGALHNDVGEDESNEDAKQFDLVSQRAPNRCKVLDT
ncbi:AbrB/MazE/SpoVT family DNA-binding domain-containing protein [Roseateles sp. MS654]|uniref:AbrB/MazE/SpoVT family DNA-binding domain-containing protein n=1 Tax=Roseateles sp. MS654 TaxID=3412685 RepID=UPI003C2E2417